MKNYLSSVTLIFSLLLASCRSNGDAISSESKGAATVAIKLNGSSYADEGSLGAQASILKNSSTPITQQTQVIPLKGNADYNIVATLTPEIETLKAQASINPVAVTGPVTTPVVSGTLYKVVVYDNSGNYVKEQNYSAGNEASNLITGLNGGSTYTFIAYSLNSSTNLPSVDSSVNVNDTTNPIVALSNMSTPITADLMYYSSGPIKVSGDSVNYLNINFSHKFSQIITTLDTSLIGTAYGQTATYTQISSIGTATIDSNYNNASLFGNGTYSSTGSGSNYQTQVLTFPNSGSSTATANPIYINNNTGTTNGNFSLSSVTILVSGTRITHQNITLNGLKVTSGVKYNLTLKFTPNDKYLTYQGSPAVRINGFVWMLQNLGATSDPTTPSIANVGNYYQYGVKNPVATATNLGSVSGWNNNIIPASNSWNLGTDFSAPVKNVANDPCPSGWRIPSDREFDRLKDATTYSVNGNISGVTTNPGSVIGAYTSKTNPSIILYFPLAGYRDPNDGHYTSTDGSDLQGYYWTTYAMSNASVYKIESKTNSWGKTFGTDLNPGLSPSTTNGSGNVVVTPSTAGMPVRCIADSPLSFN